VSVIIPTYRRAAKAAACVRALAPQFAQCVGDTEVLVGVDGRDRESVEAVSREWLAAGGDAGRLTIEEGDKVGQAAVRNRLLARARGRVLVFLNDDMAPGPEFIATHAAAQTSATNPGGALVVGRSPWVVHQPDTLLARLVRETSMVFFFDVMDREHTRDPGRDWGFRHAWLLNLSAPAALVREAGGFTQFPSTYGYEDDELAFRMSKRFGTRVHYEPRAVAQHDHAMTTRGYLEREYALGYAALGFARTAPECAAAMFGRDVGGDAEREYCIEFVVRERAGAVRVLDGFQRLDAMRAGDVDGPRASEIIAMLYQQHLLLKRWVWRRALLDAWSGAPMNAGGALAELTPAS